MKMTSLFNRNGDEIRVFLDMVDYYTSIGWSQVVAKVPKQKVPEKVEEIT